MFKYQISKKLSLLATLVWTLIIFYLCLKPSTGSEAPFEHFDKLIHFVAYFIWGILFFPSFHKQNLTFSVGFIVGLLVEISQHFFTTTRHFELLDLGSNSLGLGSALFIAQYLFQKNRD